MTERIPFEVPDRHILRQMRERLGLSQAELAFELGFSDSLGPDVIRAWEHGFRHGRPWAPTPLAWRAFRLMYVVSLACEMGGRAGLDPKGAVEFLRVNTPEALL